MNPNKQEIFDIVKSYYIKHHTKPPFVPGTSHVPYGGRIYDEKEMISLVDSALDFWLTAGHYTDNFEKSIASFLGARHCMLTNSGSSANLLAVTALTSPLLGDEQLKPGDEIITTAASFPTTVNPIIQNNLVPVFVDIEPHTHNIDTAVIKDAITPKTKAIFVAHTLGNPFDINAIIDITSNNSLYLIEDNCDSLGSTYNGKYTGTFGNMSTLSFFPPHILTTGEGGAVVTDSPLFKKIIESLRDWGRDCNCPPGHDNTCGHRFDQQHGTMPYGYDHKYIYSHIGYNLKMTDMQAAIGVKQLKKLPSFIEARQNNFNTLFTALEKHWKYLTLPDHNIKSDPVWFGFMLTVRTGAPFTRNQIVAYLEDHKIATRMLFAGNITRQPAYKDTNYRIHNTLPVTDNVMENSFWIGVYPGLTHEMLQYMVDTIDEFITNKV
ncbi:MAG: lipopolysaccharide biosynthesis protein RfbH [Candidatus Peribacteraceae bacterium]|nr:lipopolysaccharide biosynthesis protein RfbH [Candidatus Peribacteraceae bacterium]